MHFLISDIYLISGTTVWSNDAYSALSHVVTSCKNFKVRIKSAAALSIPTTRDRYGDAHMFEEVWHALAQALEHSEETEDFLEYRYCASLRTQLCHALLHLLSICVIDDLPAVRSSLNDQSRPVLKDFLVRYLSDRGVALVAGGDGVEGDDAEDRAASEDGLMVLSETLRRLKELQRDAVTDSSEDLRTVMDFLEDVVRDAEVMKEADSKVSGFTQSEAPENSK